MKFSPLYCFLLLSIFNNGYSQTPEPGRQKLFFEKVYLHTDRDYYYAGEDIWFKAYLLNAQGNQLLNTSNNLYVELITPKATIESRKVIRLDEGAGHGDFKLGDTIVAGKYKLRAYTNWMLNFGDNFIFEKELHVSADPSLSEIAATAKSGTSGVKVAPQKSAYSIQVFPEGGSMIEGVTGIVAYKALNEAGKGVKARGALISSRGDTLTNFESSELGLGKFTLKPERGVKYYLKGIYTDNTAFSAELPACLSEGFSMYLTSDSSKVTIIISTNEATLALYKDKELAIRARHAGIVYAAHSISLSSVITRIVLPNNTLPEGVASITLSDHQLRPHCERLVYIDRSTEADRITITPNKAVYRPRERVSVTIKTSNVTNKAVASANLSIAVVDAGIVEKSQSNIISYTNLESELRGKIEKPEMYFDFKNPNRLKQLDLLLMTQGWRDFVWKRIKDTTLTISYINETGFTISGIVTDKKIKDKPLPGANVTLFASGAKGQKLVGASTNEQGKFYFDNMNLEGNQSIKLVSADGKGKKTGVLSIDSLYSTPLPVKPISQSETTSPLLALFKNESAFRARENRAFDLSDSILLKEVNIRSSKTVRLFDQSVTSFGYPDQSFTITAEDEKDYQSLRHYLLTNVNGAAQDTNMVSNGVVFWAQGKPKLPRFIVDRREDLFSRVDYYDLRMKDVEKIVVRHMVGMPQNQIAFGDSISIGNTTTEATATGGNSIQDVFLIYLTLKPSAFGRSEPSLLNTRVNGYYQQRVFYQPKYPQTQLSKKQDLRTTIYWEPEVKTNNNGEATITFFNADPKTTVRIVAEGVSVKGTPVAVSTTYEVK